MIHPTQSKNEFREFLDRYKGLAIPHSPARDWKTVLDTAAEFEQVAEVAFELVHQLPRDAVADRMRSTSVFLGLPKDLQAQALSDLHAALPNVETISLNYICETFAYRRVGSTA